jgi:lipopolysaccharide export system permease protein
MIRPAVAHMMNELQRQAVVGTLRVFVLASLVALVLISVGTGAQEGIRRGLPPHLVLHTMPFVAAETLRLVIPGCLLFGVCSVFGDMSASNEILALKALGIHPLRVVWPVLLLAAMLSVFTYGLYEVCAVWGRPQMRRLVAESVDEIAYSVLRNSRAFQASGFSIVVTDVADHQLIDPIVTIHGEGDSPGATLTAQRAELKTDRRRGTLRLTCRDGRLEIDGVGTLTFAERLVHDIGLSGLDARPPEVLSPAELSAQQIPGQVQREQQFIAEAQAELQQIGTGDAERARQLTSQIDSRKKRLWRLQAETQRRWSNGFACLCFALIGAPVAIAMRTADTVSVFFACFLPILIGYYPLLVFGENLARDGYFPALSVWLANFALAVSGLVVMGVVSRR